MPNPTILPKSVTIDIASKLVFTNSNFLKKTCLSLLGVKKVHQSTAKLEIKNYRENEKAKKTVFSELGFKVENTSKNRRHFLNNLIGTYKVNLKNNISLNSNSNIFKSNTSTLMHSATPSSASHSVLTDAAKVTISVNAPPADDTDSFTLNDIDLILKSIETPEIESEIDQSPALSIKLSAAIPKYDMLYNSSGKKNSGDMGNNNVIATNPDIPKNKTPEGNFLPFQKNLQDFPLSKNPEVQKFFDSNFLKTNQSTSHSYLTTRDKEFSPENSLANNTKHIFKKNPSLKSNPDSAIAKKCALLIAERALKNSNQSTTPLRAIVSDSVPASVSMSVIPDTISILDETTQDSSKEIGIIETDSIGIKIKYAENKNTISNNINSVDSIPDTSENKSVEDERYEHELNTNAKLLEDLCYFVKKKEDRDNTKKEINKLAEMECSSISDPTEKNKEMIIVKNILLQKKIDEMIVSKKSLKTSSNENKSATSPQIYLNSPQPLTSINKKLNSPIQNLNNSKSMPSMISWMDINDQKEFSDIKEIKEFIDTTLHSKLKADICLRLLIQEDLNQDKVNKELKIELGLLVTSSDAAIIIKEVSEQVRDKFQYISNTPKKILAMKMYNNDVLENKIIEITNARIKNTKSDFAPYQSTEVEF